MKTRNAPQTSPPDLEKFVSEQNIARYRGLLSPAADEAQRRTILGLLKAEVDSLRDR